MCEGGECVMCYPPGEYKVPFSPIKECGAKGRESRLVKLRASAEKNLISLIRRVQQSNMERLLPLWLPRGGKCENMFFSLGEECENMRGCVDVIVKLASCSLTASLFTCSSADDVITRSWLSSQRRRSRSKSLTGNLTHPLA